MSEKSSSITAPDGASLVPIGYVSKAHGIRGEVVFTLTAEDPSLVDGTLYLRPRHGGAIRTFTLAQKRKHHGTFLVSLKEVQTRNDAELLRSHTVFVDKKRLPELESGEAYAADLIGLSVILVNDENDQEEELGTLTDISIPAGQMLWTIETPLGKEILFPAVEEFVEGIDLDEGTVHICPPPGLLDLYLE